MTKQVSDTSMDACLNDAAAATELYLCPGNPTNRSAAVAASLSAVTAPGTTTGPRDRTGGGREIEYGAVAGISITGDGTIDTVCQCTATELKIRTDLTASLPVNNGDTVDLGPFIHGIGDAV